MLKIAMAQTEVIPGRPDLNYRKMISMIGRARAEGAQLVIFPALSIPGRLLGDTWEQQAFLKDCEYYGHLIVEASQGMCVIFGNLGVDWDKVGNDGRVRKYNAVYIAQNGSLYRGGNLPYPFQIMELGPWTNNVHYFYSPRDLAREMGIEYAELMRPIDIEIEGDKLRLACILKLEGWDRETTSELISLWGQETPVDLLVNIAASPYVRGENNRRRGYFSRLIAEIGIPLIFVNNVGIQNSGKTIYTFDGCSTVYNSSGAAVENCPAFIEELRTLEMEPGGDFPGQPLTDRNDGGIDSIYRSLRYGISKFLSAVGIERVVIGLSGGIDSAISACLYNQVLDPRQLLLVNMPSVYSSQTTRDLSARLAKNLGCLYTIMPIQKIFTDTVRQIGETPVRNPQDGSRFHLTVSSFVQESIQARDRSARILAGVAAAFGGGFTCNTNKSELTVGYGTLYGDLAGFLAALADLWKYQIYELALYLNENIYCREVIPQEIITLVPSAELSASQDVDQGKGDPLVYPYHDYLFRAFVEREGRTTPEEILTWYCTGCLEDKIGCRAGLVKELFSGAREFIADLERWWRLYRGMGVAKRIQAPPVLAVSKRAYGFEPGEVQNPVHFTAGYHRLKEKTIRHAK